MLLVMQEFHMRGKRDPEVWKVVEQMHFHWRAGIERIVIDGVADGTFRTDIDPKVMLSMLMSIFSGIETVGVHKINGSTSPVGGASGRAGRRSSRHQDFWSSSGRRRAIGSASVSGRADGVRVRRDAIPRREGLR